MRPDSVVGQGLSGVSFPHPDPVSFMPCSPQLGRDAPGVTPVRLSGLHLLHQWAAGDRPAWQRQQEEDG